MPGEKPLSGCCRRARWLQRLQVNWVHRRHSWRLTLFYYSYSCVCCIGVLLTFILHILTSVNSFFFVNFRCGSKTKYLVRANFDAMMVMASAMALLGFLTLRMIKLFISHTLSEFKPTGSWMGRVGCLVKWLPWSMAVFTVAMIIISCINIIWIISAPHDWCSRRWSLLALEAVKNCRLWFAGTAACIKAAEHADLPDSLAKCNDGEFLQGAFFFYFIPKSQQGTCSFSQPAVCLLYKNSYSTLAVNTAPDWTSGDAVLCEGPDSTQKAMEDFMDKGNSDMYKYLLIYATAWCVAMICILFLFFYIKHTSHFEGYFGQPPSQTKHILLMPFRPFTPWVY